VGNIRRIGIYFLLVQIVDVSMDLSGRSAAGSGKKDHCQNLKIYYHVIAQFIFAHGNIYGAVMPIG
jgi:hypothetical protein